MPDHTTEPLAIVGIACRLPGNVRNPTTLWRLLERGGIASRGPPESRFNLKGHEDGSKKPKTMRSPGGMFLEDVDPALFDASFFGLSKAETVAMDPQQRQLLEVVYECTENAGIPLESLKGKAIGCFVGSYASDYQDIQSRDPEDRVANATVGIGRAMLSNRISHFFDLKGPSMTIDTACSGSLVSLDVAARYLQTHDIDAAIVAGANLYLSPEHCIDLSGMKGAASLSGLCHTFDAKSDGYIKAEAVNALIVKRLTDAIRDGDPIRAVIRGIASNSDGWTPGIAQPNSKAQAAVTRRAYRNAGITDFNATTYLECHGTGTKAGDPIEISGVASVFCTDRKSDQPLLIGSIKSNIGHSEPAAGISGVLKTILALEHAVIPGNPTFMTPNPNIDFDTLRVRASRYAQPWPRCTIKRASVNSFGYGGSNAHVILDEVASALPKEHRRFKSSYRSSTDVNDFDDFFDGDDEKVERPHLLLFSANDKSSLQSYTKRLELHLLDPNTNVNLPDLAYTLSERRSRHFFRAACVARKVGVDERNLVYGQVGASKPRIGFIFSGQGAQWSAMGKDLFKSFPASRTAIQKLDAALRTLPNPPKWRLYDELVGDRPAEHLREPKFSQPLTTALQLCLLAVLDSWGVSAHAVVGHSSGEIAAAAAAGILSFDEAIKVAFLRGEAAVQRAKLQPAERLGMLAVGLGRDAPLLQEHLERFHDTICIACVNSPKSVTLAGPQNTLTGLETAVKKAGFFARLLRVDLAYHSSYMSEIASTYEQLLSNCSYNQDSNRYAKMFSSVSGTLVQEPIGSAYWRANMESPVKFHQAVSTMLKDENPVDFLVELGPNNTLAGPIKDILASLSGQAKHTPYQSAWKMGSAALENLYGLAGAVYLRGGDVNVAAVNAYAANGEAPHVLTDIPNYHWNHSTKYWFESEASKEWRFRKYVNHDILGSRLLGVSWKAPSWKKVIRVTDLAWLADHEVGGQVLFPAAAYIAMAIEAIFQSSQSRGFIDSERSVREVSYRLRNVAFKKALILDNDETRVMLALHPEDDRDKSWNKFSITSLLDGSWVEHSSGLVALSDSKPAIGSAEKTGPLQHAVDASVWYKAMRDVGYTFGKLFQTQLEIEAFAGSRDSRALISFEEPLSQYPQSPYSVHPVTIDGCLQSAAPALWRGIRSQIGAALVPAGIGNMTIFAHPQNITTGLAATSVEYIGVGADSEAVNYRSHTEVFDNLTKERILDIHGLTYHKLDTFEDNAMAHTHMYMDWQPDIRLLSNAQLDVLLRSQGQNPLSTLCNLLRHFRPQMKVVEINQTSASESLWVGAHFSREAVLAFTGSYDFAVRQAAVLIDTQQNLSSYGKICDNLVDLSRPEASLTELPSSADLAIINFQQYPESSLENVLLHCRSLLAAHGLLFVKLSADTLTSDGSVNIREPEPVACEIEHLCTIFPAENYEIVSTYTSNTDETYVLARVCLDVLSETKEDESVIMLSLRDGPAITKLNALVRADFEAQGIETRNAANIADGNIARESTVLVIDELDSPIVHNLTEQQWSTIQTLLQHECRILWVTQGSQMHVSAPHGALVHGMSRVIRNENPDARFFVLDIENATSATSRGTITTVMKSLLQKGFDQGNDWEFAERRGLVHTSRLHPAEALNQFEQDDVYGQEPKKLHLHDNPSTVRLMCHTPGLLESLCFTEVATTDLPLPDDFVEVDVHASGLNYKDVATVLGIVPENQYLLGLEGAGVVRRAGAKANFTIGQRVLVYRRGSLANKVQCPVEGVHPIPDWMSFEDAATLPVVFLCVIYSLFNLASIQRGHTILIHSAAGGVGLAALQICKHVGAEVFATVGSDEKREFLMRDFQLPAERIFSSRNTDFASAIKAVTRGKGVNIILNSLTGDLLDESWQLIADCGVMVEIGKKDILARNSLSMEPFNRNASFRAIDMSHDSISRPQVAVLMKQLFALIEAGVIKPIAQRTVFSYNRAADAIRYMRGGTHIGKIIVSRSAKDADPINLIRPAKTTLQLRDDRSYIIVGGLRGVCGSLAVYLALHGARNLIIMGRSGFEDARSQKVLQDLKSLGASCQLFKGDVGELEDVRDMFATAAMPIDGIIMGAMVLEDGMYETLSLAQFNAPLKCKVAGSWNLHTAVNELDKPVSFFTMLSSISGLVGQKGQANYAAGNSFQDALAAYRHSLGLSACSIDLGVIEDVGYISERKAIADRLDIGIWTHINESLLHRILRASIFQQQFNTRISSTSPYHLVTGIPYPQNHPGPLDHDARFSALFRKTHIVLDAGAAEDPETAALRALLTLVAVANVDAGLLLESATTLLNLHFTSGLGLSEPMEPAKPLAIYGLDSLAAVEFRNWIRKQFGIVVTTLDIVGAKTLVELAGKVIERILEKGKQR